MDEKELSVLQAQIAGARILLAEDSALNRHVIRDFLQGALVDLDVAEHGVAAAERALAGNYDAVLMDVQMPRMNGLEATTRIRHDPRCRALPIIALTAETRPGDREKCLDAGMDDYVTKPVTQEVLLRTLARWLKEGSLDLRRMENAQAPANHTAPAKDFSTLAKSGIFDLKTALGRLGGNEPLYETLLALFVDEQSQTIVKLDRHLRDKDYAAAQRVAHTLKSSAAGLGATRLVCLAGELEKGCAQQNGSQDTLEAIGKALTAAFGAIKAHQRRSHESQACPARGSWNPDQAQKEIQTLRRYLKEGNLKALPWFARLKEKVPTDCQKASFFSLEQALQRFDMQTAQKELESMLCELASASAEVRHD